MPKEQFSKSSSMRLDQYLLEKKYFSSRKKAQSAILAGDVLVETTKVLKPGYSIKLNTKVLPQITIKKRPPYVSRGGLKLEKALNFFEISPKGKNCIDVGSSTGGFTDCLLKKGADFVYCVDSGTNQLDFSLRNHPNTKVMEKTNARYLEAKDFEHKLELAVMDVSFISITKMIPMLKSILIGEARLVTLIKPQFEGDRGMIESGGIVKNKDNHQLILTSLTDFFTSNNISLESAIFSPITGAKGNIEYLFDLKLHPSKTPKSLSSLDIQTLINTAFSSLR